MTFFIYIIDIGHVGSLALFAHLYKQDEAMFANRLDAGQHLADELIRYKNFPNAFVLAIPRGGVMTGYVVAQHLELPLEVELIKKIGHPSDLECSIGAVSLDGSILSDSSDVPPEYFVEQKGKAIKELRERHKLYFGDRKVISAKGKTVILVDDGIATGNTMKLAIQLIKIKEPAKVILATPVAPKNVLLELTELVDEVHCLEKAGFFQSVGSFYEQFHPVKDGVVIRLLHEMRVEEV